MLGHSEGAETDLTLVAEDKRVLAIMLLAGGSRPVDEVAIEQELYQRTWQMTPTKHNQSARAADNNIV